MARREPERRKPRRGARLRSPQAYGNGAGSKGRSRSGDFVLYVEGARDRELLECWARRVDVELGRCIEQSAVILGGRQPARAVADFRRRGGAEAGLSGLVVLDRDHHDETPAPPEETGLDLFVWSLRHIESYVLVPGAIRRTLGLDADDRRIERFFQEHAGQSVHAKRVLGTGGVLSQLLGAELRASQIARAMRTEELHGDIHQLFREIGSRVGLFSPAPEVVVRPGASSGRVNGSSARLRPGRIAEP